MGLLSEKGPVLAVLLVCIASTLERKTAQELSEPLLHWELLQLGRILSSEAILSDIAEPACSQDCP